MMPQTPVQEEEYLVRHGLSDGGLRPTRGPGARVKGILHELSVVQSIAWRYQPRVFADILMSRLLRLAHLPREDVPRTVRMRDGTLLTYRLNRGDIQALREIWLDQVYLPPPEAAGLRQVIDLGANIGFTSLYLSRLLGGCSVIAVEPDPANAQILKRNLEQNGVDATVIQAAVGPSDGVATFRRDRGSNLGRLDPTGELRVELISMDSLLQLAADQVEGGLLKVDIEGGEEQLFTGDLSWLSYFDCLMAELHPPQADLRRITTLIEESGLAFRPGGGRGNPPSCWVRHGA